MGSYRWVLGLGLYRLMPCSFMGACCNSAGRFKLSCLEAHGTPELT